MIQKQLTFDPSHTLGLMDDLCSAMFFYVKVQKVYKNR